MVSSSPSSSPASVRSTFYKEAATHLAMHVKKCVAGNGTSATVVENFRELCVTVARGIDHSVLKDEVPTQTEDFVLQLKQVCKHNKEFPEECQAAIMVLMISVKSACKKGWFPVVDSRELISLTNKIGQSFNSTENYNARPGHARPVIKEIMSKFYPSMRIIKYLAILEVTSGYGVYVGDFSITKDMMMASSQEKIWLLVAEMDDTSTSSCIINPPLVNILLNGKGVEGRTNVSMEKGPQLPTDVTSMLQYGANLLQAIGDFNGNCIIIVAIMSASSTTSKETPSLPDYVKPSVDAYISDPEVIEGPSRIKLDCPISMTRIVLPVKGRLCKHLQCFDYENFMTINSRSPSWRCPHCKQSVCFTDLRVDQKMSKILGALNGDVLEVIIFEDGLWKPLLKDSSGYKSEQLVEVSSPSSSATLIAGGEDGCETASNCEIEDRKPFLDIPQDYISRDSIASPHLNVSEFIRHSPPNDFSFWARVLSTCSSERNQEVLNAQLTTQPVHSLRPPRRFENPGIESSLERQLGPGEVSQATLALHPPASQHQGANTRQQTNSTSRATNSEPDASQYLRADCNIVTANDETIEQLHRRRLNTLNTSNVASSLQVEPLTQMPVQQLVGAPIRTNSPASHRASQVPQFGAQGIRDKVRSTRALESSLNVFRINEMMQNSNRERLRHFSSRSLSPIAGSSRSYPGQQNSENQQRPQPMMIPTLVPNIQQSDAQYFMNGAGQNMTCAHPEFYAAAVRENQMRGTLESMLPSRQMSGPVDSSRQGQSNAALNGQSYSQALNQFFTQLPQSYIRSEFFMTPQSICPQHYMTHQNYIPQTYMTPQSMKPNSNLTYQTLDPSE